MGEGGESWHHSNEGEILFCTTWATWDPLTSICIAQDTYLLTYSMEQSPSWEVNWSAASQKIPHILWNLKVHYQIHKCPPTVPILSQLDPVHTHTSPFLKIHLNIILPSTPEFSKWLFPSGIPTKTLYASPLPIGATCPTHLILLNLITQIIFGEE